MNNQELYVITVKGGGFHAYEKRGNYWLSLEYPHFPLVLGIVVPQSKGRVLIFETNKNGFIGDLELEYIINTCESRGLIFAFWGNEVFRVGGVVMNLGDAFDCSEYFQNFRYLPESDMGTMYWIDQTISAMMSIETLVLPSPHFF